MLFCMNLWSVNNTFFNQSQVKGLKPAAHANLVHDTRVHGIANPENFRVADTLI